MKMCHVVDFKCIDISVHLDVHVTYNSMPVDSHYGCKPNHTMPV